MKLIAAIAAFLVTAILVALFFAYVWKDMTIKEILIYGIATYIAWLVAQLVYISWPEKTKTK